MPTSSQFNQMRRHVSTMQLAQDTVAHFMDYSDTSLSHQSVERITLMRRHAEILRHATESFILYLEECLRDPKVIAVAGGASVSTELPSEVMDTEAKDLGTAIDTAPRLLPAARKSIKRPKRKGTRGVTEKTQNIRLALADFLLESDEVTPQAFRDFLDKIRTPYVKHDVHLIFNVLYTKGLFKRNGPGLYTPKDKRRLMAFLTKGTPAATSWTEKAGAALA